MCDPNPTRARYNLRGGRGVLGVGWRGGPCCHPSCLRLSLKRVGTPVNMSYVSFGQKKKKKGCIEGNMSGWCCDKLKKAGGGAALCCVSRDHPGENRTRYIVYMEKS